MAFTFKADDKIVFNMGDRVVYSGSLENLRGRSGIVTRVHGQPSQLDPRYIHWSYWVVLDNGDRLRGVRGKSLSPKE